MHLDSFFIGYFQRLALRVLKKQPWPGSFIPLSLLHSYGRATNYFRRTVQSRSHKTNAASGSKPTRLLDDLMLITEASSHSAQGLFDLLDDFTNASGLKKKSKLLISGKNILRRRISSILDLEEGTKTYLPILVPQDLKRKRNKRKVKTIKRFPPPSPKALTKARSLWRQQLLKMLPAKTKKPVFGEGEDEPKRPRETLEERKKKK